MINLLIKGIFWIITQLFNLLTAPIIATITVLFPSLSSFFNSISVFLGYAFTYIRSILNLLLIPDPLIIALFDYFVILYSIFIGIQAYKFAINIYNKLKI